MFFGGKSYPRPCGLFWFSRLSLQLQTGRTHQHILYDRAPRRGRQVRGQATGRMYEGHGAWKGRGCCLYIIAGRSSGKTSDDCPRRRAVE